MVAHETPALGDGPAIVHRRSPADRRLWISLAFLFAVGVFSLGPVAYVILSSFKTAGAATDFSLSTWQQVFSDPDLRRSIGMSFLLSLRVPVGIVIAFTATWLLIRVEVPGHQFIEICLWFGFFLPTVPLVTGWILLLDGSNGLINRLIMSGGLAERPLFEAHSVGGILWIHLTLHTIPIMIILLSPAFRQVDTALEEAAYTSGAGRLMILRTILLPLLAPAVAIAATASLIKSLESFEVEQLLGVPADISVYSTDIYRAMADEPPDFPLAMALSCVFLVVLLALAVLYRGIFAPTGDRPTFTGRSAISGVTYPGWLRIGGSAVLIGFVVIGILLPFGALFLGSFMRLFGFFSLPDPWTGDHWLTVLGDPAFARSAVNSVLLGMVTGILGTVLFAMIAWALVRTNLRFRALVSFFVWLPWAIPGLVLGVVMLDLTLNVPPLAIFYGTMFPVVLALLVKEMPIGVQLLRAAVGQAPRSLEEAALVSGSSRGRSFRTISLPLMAPALVAVFLFVFAATIRDISTIVLIAPPDMQTLSLLMFAYANIGDFEAAAVIGTMVAVISLALAIAARLLSKRTGIVR